MELGGHIGVFETENQNFSKMNMEAPHNKLSGSTEAESSSISLC